MDWIDKMDIINQKVAKLNTVIGAKDFFTASSCIISDYECSKKLLEISHKDWEKLLAVLYQSEQKKLACKIELLVCYINELKRLANVNIKELTGLTRDDIATLQRTSVLKKNATKKSKRTKIIETLTVLVDLAAEADINDRYLTEACKKHAKTKTLENY